MPAGNGRTSDVGNVECTFLSKESFTGLPGCFFLQVEKVVKNGGAIKSGSVVTTTYEYDAQSGLMDVEILIPL